MELTPVILIIFKVSVLAIAMFFAVKWHYDQDKIARKSDLLLAVGKIAVILVLSLICLLFATFQLAGMLGLDLAFAP